MKVIESSMPEMEYWETLFEIPKILEVMQVNKSVVDLAEIGCGYGTFTVPTAKRITGKVFAFDIDEVYLDRAVDRASVEGIKNVDFINRDCMDHGTDLPDASISYVMLFNILHNENPSDLIQEAKRILCNHGRIGVIHWRSDIETPRGPSLEIRPKPEYLVQEFQKLDLHCTLSRSLNPYHYGLLFTK
jgi:ubiquinone/menaquinone biosynthesis C-methylase UbiE